MTIIFVCFQKTVSSFIHPYLISLNEFAVMSSIFCTIITEDFRELCAFQLDLNTKFF